MPSSRRRWLANSFLWGSSVGAFGAGQRALERLGIACQLANTESRTRETLATARAAGFRSVQVQFSWDHATAEFLKALPGWLRAEGLRADVLGAYVNCASPETVIMGCRHEDFARALDYAATLDCRRVVAWTGGFGTNLMKADSRNFTQESEDRILRFLEPFLPKLEQTGLTLALETYITLVCPDAPSLARLLSRLPKSVGAVLDPPNLTPVARYQQRDQALHEMVRLLRSRVAVVHLKDFRLAPDGASYQLPGPLDGEMNYPLYVKEILALPGAPPIIAEHLPPAKFENARKRLVQVFQRA